MSVRYLDLADYLAIAVEVTRLDIDTLSRVASLGLADSALHAPAAGFGETDLYPGFLEKAAVLVVRLAKNHPLPDGNKRAAWVSLRLFVEINGWIWDVRPSVDDAEQAVLSVASGDWGEQEMAAWLAKHIKPATTG
ncbi:MAG: type II toxin-antitoxin system death-on-curing family toxin [Solirubrobacteraceae bacterium]